MVQKLTCCRVGRRAVSLKKLSCRLRSAQEVNDQFSVVSMNYFNSLRAGAQEVPTRLPTHICIRRTHFASDD
jgi:hypothetical protein